MNTPYEKARLLREAILKKFPERINLENSMCVVPWHNTRSFLIYTPIKSAYKFYLLPHLIPFLYNHLEGCIPYIDSDARGMSYEAGIFLPDGILEDNEFEALLGLILMYGGE